MVRNKAMKLGKTGSASSVMVSKSQQGVTPVVDAENRNGCLHSLTMYEDIKDKHGRDRTVRYALVCILKHNSSGRSYKKQVHKDSAGRTWK